MLINATKIIVVAVICFLLILSAEFLRQKSMARKKITREEKFALGGLFIVVVSCFAFLLLSKGI